MKGYLVSLALVIVVAMTALSSANAGATQAQRVYSWGDPWGGGDPKGLQYYGPTQVNGTPDTIVQISTSNSTSYALTKSGEVWAWGVGRAGALGNGSMMKSTTVPVRVKFPKGVKIASLPSPMPFDTGMAIDDNGNIWGWGSNVEHSLCKQKGNLSYPVKLPFSHVTQASGAGGHGLYVSDGKLYACGGNTAGELGDGSTAPSTRPVAVVGLPKESIRAIGSSWENSGALMADGSYYDWGYNNAGQLGNGTTTNSDTPVRVNLPTKAEQVSLGGSSAENGQTVAILTDGSLWAWGQGGTGQIGDGKVANSTAPTRVDVPSGVSFDRVISGGSTVYGIDSSDAVWAWGQNNVGQLGFGASSALSDRPSEVGIHLSCVSSTAANVVGLAAEQSQCNS